MQWFCWVYYQFLIFYILFYVFTLNSRVSMPVFHVLCWPVSVQKSSSNLAKMSFFLSSHPEDLPVTEMPNCCLLPTINLCNITCDRGDWDLYQVENHAASSLSGEWLSWDQPSLYMYFTSLLRQHTLSSDEQGWLVQLVNPDGYLMFNFSSETIDW